MRPKQKIHCVQPSEAVIMHNRAQQTNTANWVKIRIIKKKAVNKKLRNVKLMT